MFTIFYTLKNRSHNLGKWIVPKYVDPEDDAVVTEFGPQEYTRELWEYIQKNQAYKGEPVDEAFLCYGGILTDHNTQVTEYTVIEKWKDGKLTKLSDPVPMKKVEVPPPPTPTIVIPASELQPSEPEPEPEIEEEDEVDVETDVDDDEPESEIEQTETTEDEDPDNVEEEFD